MVMLLLSPLTALDCDAFPNDYDDGNDDNSVVIDEFGKSVSCNYGQYISGQEDNDCIKKTVSSTKTQSATYTGITSTGSVPAGVTASGKSFTGTYTNSVGSSDNGFCFRITWSGTPTEVGSFTKTWKYTETVNVYNNGSLSNTFTYNRASSLSINVTYTSYSITYTTYDGTINGSYKTTYTQDVGATLPTNVTKENYSFGGWCKTYSNNSGTGTTYTAIEPGETGNKTFYAKWIPLGYDVSFDANGGSGSQTGSSQVTSITLPSCTFTAPTGKHFNGWAEGSASGTVYQAGTTRSISANTTYYATWDWDTYAVDFNTNGGPAVSSQNVTHGNTATAPSTAPYNNHGTTSISGTDMVFLYWCSDPGLSTQYNFSTTITSAKTIYAKWIDVLRFTSVPSAQMVSTPSGNNVYSFKALTANAVGISWNLGDGTIYDNVEEIEHRFAPGTYTVALTAYNSNGEYTDYYTIEVPELQDEDKHDINETLTLLGIIGGIVIAVVVLRRFL